MNAKRNRPRYEAVEAAVELAQRAMPAPIKPRIVEYGREERGNGTLTFSPPEELVALAGAIPNRLLGAYINEDGDAV